VIIGSRARGACGVRGRRLASTHVVLRIEVTAVDDPDGARVLAAAEVLLVEGLRECEVSRIYNIRGDLAADQIDQLCAELLADPVVDVWNVGWTEPRGHAVEVAVQPGVTDADARELERAAAELGLPAIEVATAVRYDLIGGLAPADIARLVDRELVNHTVERWSDHVLKPEFASATAADLTVGEVKLDGLDDESLVELSRTSVWSLDLDEMMAIRDHFEALGRPPTDAEMETLAQTWSEHCVHKTFRAAIDLAHRHHDGTETATHHDGLLAALREVTEELDPWWLRSAFVDDAGIVAFDDLNDVAFKVETHNHPSALEPFGGANTGVGGVVRDVIAVSARPIACTDVLCFGPADLPESDLPSGVLHPRRVRDGVVAGIGDYGNKLGLPTVNGAVLYSPGYVGNPLVYCGSLGLLPHGSHPIEARIGDRIISIGGRVGRDGIHGATFSSAGMDAGTGEAVGTAVQIGDPITEKGCIEVVERARDARLYTAITDCGAGGFSSSVGEMGKDLGVEVDLSGVHLKYPGLSPWEIWLSEAQERMVLAVPPANVAALSQICEQWDVELTDLGEFTGSHRLVVRHGGTPVVDMTMDFVHDGLPRRHMKAVWTDPAADGGRLVPFDGDVVLALLAHPDVASNEEIVRRYDHEVRGGTIVRPFVGPHADGPADAAVLKPLGTAHNRIAVVLSNGICPRVGLLDPKAMALFAIDEAVRNLVAVGGDPDRVALLDNFCWGDPTKPDRLGGLVRAVQGCVDGARSYKMPFISGKDSLFNEFDGEAIPGTLLISALGFVPDIAFAVDSAGASPADDVWLLGSGSEAMGGSLVNEVLDLGATVVPDPPSEPLIRYRALHRAIAAGLVNSAHDCSEGGLAVAVAEMAIGARLGFEITVPCGSGDPLRTFTNESPGRIVFTANSSNREAITTMVGDHAVVVGTVMNEPSIRFICDGHTVEVATDTALAAFKSLVG